MFTLTHGLAYLSSGSEVVFIIYNPQRKVYI